MTVTNYTTPIGKDFTNTTPTFCLVTWFGNSGAFSEYNPTGNSLLAFNGNSGNEPTEVQLTDGQLAIGSSTGVPAAGNITSTGGSVTITNGHNTINLEASGATSGVVAAAIFDSSGTTSYTKNVTSVSKSTSGGLDRYTITMTTPAASANYNVVVGGYIAIAGRYGYSNTGWTPTSSSVLEVSAATGTYTGFNVSIIGG